MLGGRIPSHDPGPLGGENRARREMVAPLFLSVPTPCALQMQGDTPPILLANWVPGRRTPICLLNCAGLLAPDHHRQPHRSGNGLAPYQSGRTRPDDYGYRQFFFSTFLMQAKQGSCGEKQGCPLPGIVLPGLGIEKPTHRSISPSRGCCCSAALETNHLQPRLSRMSPSCDHSGLGSLLCSPSPHSCTFQTRMIGPWRPEEVGA